MEEKKQKYYTSSDGTKTLMQDVEFTHLTRGLAKKYQDIFTSTNKNEFSKRLEEINDIKEEVHRRINTFNEGLSEEEVKEEA